MGSSIMAVDLLVAAVILISTGYAIWRGFMWETLTIFAWVVAAFVCLYFGPVLVPPIRNLVSSRWLAGLLAYSLVFLAVLIPIAFVTHRFSQQVKGSPIGPLDRALGAAFGVVRGLVIVGLVYIGFTWFVPVPEQPRWLTRARTLPIIQDTDAVLLSLVPAHARPGFPLTKAREPVRRDAVGELIRRQETAENRAEPAQHRHAPARQKRYGARDREALDRLIETTGSGQ